jgi:hypothetical protein
MIGYGHPKVEFGNFIYLFHKNQDHIAGNATIDKHHVPVQTGCITAAKHHYTSPFYEHNI